MLRCSGTDASISDAIEGLTAVLNELHRLFGTTTPEQLVKIAKATVDERNAMKETIGSLTGTVGVLRTQAADKDVHAQDPNKPLPKGREQERAEKAAQKAEVQASRRAQIAAYAGRNDTERAMTLLSRERPGFDRLDRMDQVQAASSFLRGE